jgi:copper(I)-binding protein
MKPVLLGLLLSLSCAGLSYAHEIKFGNLVIVRPMVAEAKKGQASAQGLVKIRNEGNAADQLLAITAEFADKVTIGKPVPVLVPAGGQPVSVPLTFEKIKRKLSEHEAYDGELVFGEAGTIQVDLMVQTYVH